MYRDMSLTPGQILQPFILLGLKGVSRFKQALWPVVCASHFQQKHLRLLIAR